MLKKYTLPFLLCTSMLSVGYAEIVHYETPIVCKTLADEKDDPLAQYNYAIMLRDGILGVAQDLPQAAKYFKKSADKGLGLSQWSYGLMLRDGVGTDQNFQEAARYLLLAADQNIPEAQYEYALLLRDGREGVGTGIAPNPSKAATYFKKAADAGFMPAQYEYGLMLRDGKGISKNPRESIRYLRMASAKGHTDALNILQASR